MYLKNSDQIKFIVQQDSIQNCPIGLYKFTYDNIDAVFAPTSLTFNAPSGLDIRVGDTILIEPSLNAFTVDLVTGDLITISGATGLSGAAKFHAIRPCLYSNGGRPSVFEAMPKDLALLSTMSDRTITRAWIGRIARETTLNTLIDSKSRYALKMGETYTPVALVENLVYGSANPSLFWSLYLVP